MSLSNFSRKIWSSLTFAFQVTAVMWAIQAFQYFLNFDLGRFGVFPRTDFGLRGIIFSPFIHANWEHLMANTPPLFALVTLIQFFYRRVALPSMLTIYLLTGAAVWAFGRPVFHIGASGVIYGLVAFVFWTGIFRRNLKSIALALLVAFYYGSMFLGILPGQEGISWESHLLGGIVGIFVAFIFKGSVEQDEKPRVPSWELDGSAKEDQFFLDRDVFDRTLEQRKKEKLERRDDGYSNWFSNRT